MGQDPIVRTILSLRFCGITETPSKCDGWLGRETCCSSRDKDCPSSGFDD